MSDTPGSPTFDVRVGSRVLIPADVLRIDMGGDGGEPMAFVRVGFTPEQLPVSTIIRLADIAGVVPLVPTVFAKAEVDDGRADLSEDEYTELLALLAENGYRQVHDGMLHEFVGRMLNDGWVPLQHETYRVLIYDYLVALKRIERVPFGG